MEKNNKRDTRQNLVKTQLGVIPGTCPALRCSPFTLKFSSPVASHPANNQASPALARASLFFPLYFSTLFPSKLPAACMALGLGKVWLATDYVVSIVSA